MNNLMMGMLAIAATAFTSCSNEDSLDQQGTSKSVENFYMKLQVTGNNPSGSRTQGQATEDGTTAESTIKSGTIWLVDAQGNVAFSKEITAADWGGTQTSKPIKVAVTQVSQNTPYQVYFLANKKGELTQNPTQQELTSETGGVDLAQENGFVMFNENDKEVKANTNTVTFAEANKKETNPASPAQAIKLDRVTARIDMPTSATEIVKPVDETVASTSKTQNIEAIKSVDLQSYAPFNVAKKTNMIQTWDSKWEVLQLPNALGTLYHAKEEFGDGYHIGNSADINPGSFTDGTSYIFENVQDEAENATGIFLKYKATPEETANLDFADGTFYRYDKCVFTSIQGIIRYAGAANPFGEKTAAQVVDEIKGNPNADDPTKFNLTTDESKIEAFRHAYNIEVFEQGMVYYQYLIEDANHTGKKYSVLRNSIYRLNIKAIYDLGSDTPNTPELFPNYYLNVEVAVNPWVLVSKDIELR